MTDSVMTDPLICGACGKVYLYGDDDGLCDDPNCRGAVLDPLLGFISYRRKYQSHKGMEENDLASRIKDRVEKVLHARRIGGGFFIDKTGIEREDFEEKISRTLLACKNKVMILILTPGALDPRDNKDEDWMRKEIALALEHSLEIIPIKVSKYRQDRDFDWPESLPSDIAPIQKKNVTLSYIGDLDERYLVDATHHLVNEIIKNLKIDTGISALIVSDTAPNNKANTQVSLDISQWKKIVSKKMVEIPSGRFLMGSEHGTASEQPIHEVEVSSFYMMKCPVTQKDYEKICGTNPSNFIGDPNECGHVI